MFRASTLKIAGSKSLFILLTFFFCASFNLYASIVETNEIDETAMTPIVFCPHDVTVSCVHYTGNPSDYGQPTVTNQGAHVIIVEHPAQSFTNSCGIGHIIRTWTIKFQFGSFHCTQKITITGVGGSFGAHNIHWPLDYTVEGCHADVHPDNIPHPFSRPTWTSGPCSQIGVSFQDHVFTFNAPDFSTPGGGCKKILRKWKIIDWCTYNVTTGAGLWTYTQVIKILDNEPPRFVFCPQDFTVGTFDNNCNGAYVNFPRPIATDNCNQNVRIRNNSPYTYSSMGDASGFYPLGTTTVRFIADDGCQNFDTCFVRVTVRDLKAPSPVCHYGLTTTLMPMGDDGFVQLDPRLFDAGSTDNCTPRHLLQFTLDRNTFTCADRGRQDVRLFVTDQSGNTAQCNTFVNVQDNMGVCPPDTSGGIISGLVQFVNSVRLEGVEMYASMEDEEPKVLTDQHGLYSMETLVEGYDYEIMASKHTSLVDGISTADLIHLRRHITGERRLTNPYKIIAADVNRDGQITIQDYLQLRMLLLLNLQDFPGMKSWRFIDEAYEFENPLNPLAEPFVEVYKIENHTKTDMNINFVGVKIGDIDGSCIPVDEDDSDEWFSSSSRTVNTLELSARDKLVRPGQTVSLDIQSRTSMSLQGMQMTLLFDQDALDFVGLTGRALEGLTENNLGLNRLEEGIITLSWDRMLPVVLQLDDMLASLAFEAKRFGSLSEMVAVSSTPLRAEAYDNALKISDIQLNFERSTDLVNVSTGIDMLQSSPNPFSTECLITFFLADAGHAEIMIHDLTGKLVKLVQIDAVKGENNLRLHSTDFPAPGMYMYTLMSNGHRITKKLMFK